MVFGSEVPNIIGYMTIFKEWVRLQESDGSPKKQLNEHVQTNMDNGGTQEKLGESKDSIW
jgi:hypothetical protein